MTEELNLDHFDLGTFVDYVHALKQERDALRAQLPSRGGEAVATDAFVPGSLADLLFQLGEKGIGVSGGTHGDHWRVTPLYTHPADQVAEGDAELVELLRDERAYGPLGVNCQNGVVARCVCRMCRLRRIDAKLASLEAKP